jgi:hypothetical protein
VNVLANQFCQTRRRPITARKTQDVVAGGREHFGDPAFSAELRLGVLIQFPLYGGIAANAAAFQRLALRAKSRGGRRDTGHHKTT